MVLLALVVALHAPAQSQSRKPIQGKSDAEIFKELEAMEKEQASRPPHPKLPRQDPCTLLTDADVRKVMKDAKPGQRARRLEDTGISMCEWRSDRGRHVTLYLETLDRRGKPDGKGEPLSPEYRRVAGIGDEAAAMVMRRDDKQGRPDLAVIGARKGPLAFRIEFNDIVQLSDDKAVDALRQLAMITAGRL
jgi:hypothetical protein